MEHKNSYYFELEEKILKYSKSIIEIIFEYNLNHDKEKIKISDLFISNFNSDIEKQILSFIEDCCMNLLRNINISMTFDQLEQNQNFQNIFKFLTRQNLKVNNDLTNFNHYYEIDENIDLICNEIILYTILKLPKMEYTDLYVECVNSNLFKIISSIKYSISLLPDENNDKQIVKNNDGLVTFLGLKFKTENDYRRWVQQGYTGYSQVNGVMTVDSPEIEAARPNLSN